LADQRHTGSRFPLVLANAPGKIERVFSDKEILELTFAEDGKMLIRRVAP